MGLQDHRKPETKQYPQEHSRNRILGHILLQVGQLWWPLLWVRFGQKDLYMFFLEVLQCLLRNNTFRYHVESGFDEFGG